MSKTVYFVIISIFIFEIVAIMPYFNVLLRDWLVRLLLMWILATQIFKIRYLKQMAAFCGLLLLMAVSIAINVEIYESLGNAAFVTLLTVVVSWIQWSQS